MASERPPYPGLRSFKANESEIFFGRDDCVDAMLDRLAATRFLAVLGSSGIGKSSLVRTGLLSALHMGLLRGAGSSWQVVDFRPAQPEASPLRNLVRAILEKAGQPATPDDITRLRDQFMQDGPRALLKWCRKGHLPAGTNFLLLVDQFEELFRYRSYSSSEEAEAFVALLLESRKPLEAATPQQAELPIYVTLTMRSEFLGHCSLIQRLAEAITEGAFLTPRMTREQYREAIVGPLEVYGIKIDETLVNRMLNDLAAFAPWDEQEAAAHAAEGAEAGNEQEQPVLLARRADQLPVLQHALNQIWRRARDRRDSESSSGEGGSDAAIELTLDDYKAIGGLDNALNAHADAVLNDVVNTRGAEVKGTTERLFRALVTGATPSEAIRRPTRFGELVEITEDEAGARAIVEAFRADEANFLMPETSTPLTPDTVIDISHESLIRQWKRYSQWVADEAAAAQQWRRLNDSFNMGELLRGRTLENFIAWRDETRPNAAWARRYSGTEYGTVAAFLARSDRAEKRRRWARNIGGAGAFALAVGAALAMYSLWQSARSERNQAELAARNERNASIDIAQVATLARHQFSEAIGNYESRVEDVLNWAPSSWAAYLHRQKAEGLEAMGKFESALDEIQLAQNADPDYLPALITAADLDVISGRADAAVRNSEAYMQVIKTDVVAYGNLIIAQAMLRNYAGALGSIRQALQYARMPFGDTESLIAPDVQAFVHGFKLSVPDSDFLLAMRYTAAAIDAMKGDQGFEAALDAADKSDRDFPYSRNAYLTALNWLWLIVRGQASHDVQVAQANDKDAKLEALADYGAYAVEGALWDRVAQTRPDYHQRARLAFEKFKTAYGRSPQERYKSLAAWVDRKIGEQPPHVPPEPTMHCPNGGDLPFVDCAQATAQQAQELKATEGTYASEFAPAYAELTAAIRLLRPEKGETPGRRQRDLLIDLLLRRAHWRLEGGSYELDKGGAAEDAQAVLALDSKVPEAYTILASAAFDDQTRKVNDEKALELDPYNGDALQDLADVIADKDPKSAIALLQKRARVATLWSSDYRLLARLQMRVGNYAQALRDIDNSIAHAPWNLDYYSQRRDIEQKTGGTDAAAVNWHYVQGLRDAAAYEARVGSDSDALQRYLLAFLTASALDASSADDKFELETIIRNFSGFLSGRYGLADAALFWQSLSHDPLLNAAQQQLAAQEFARLGQQQSVNTKN